MFAQFSSSLICECRNPVTLSHASDAAAAGPAMILRRVLLGFRLASADEFFSRCEGERRGGGCVFRS